MEVGLFVKYGTKWFNGVHGHRGDVSYESRVYSNVLDSLRFSTPRFYGVHRERDGTPWLFLEYMGKGYPASWSMSPEPIIRSAAWIGRFHAANERRTKDPGLRFLRRYDSQYYRGWARRARRLFRRGFPWILPVCEKFEKGVPKLLSAPQTVIHGEYFGSNVFYQRGLSRPIDWQSAAIAPGEVDLASLTHSWVSPVVKRCVREYVRARWPGGEPEYFREVFELARTYMSLRWLGDPEMMSEFAFKAGHRSVSQNVILAMQAMSEIRSAGQKLGFTD